MKRCLAVALFSFCFVCVGAEHPALDISRLKPIDEGCTVRMEADGSAVFDIPVYGVPPRGSQAFIARCDLNGDFDLSNSAGIEFDFRCSDISAFGGMKVLFATRNPAVGEWAGYYDVAMRPGAADADGWRHVEIRKADAREIFGHPLGFGAVTTIRFFFSLHPCYPKPITCCFRNLRYMPDEDLATDVWVMDSDVTLPEMEIGQYNLGRKKPHVDALHLAGLKITTVRETDFPSEIPPSVKMVVLTENLYLPDRVAGILEPFADRGGRIVFARQQRDAFRRKILKLGAGEDIAFKFATTSATELKKFYIDRVKAWFPELAVLAAKRRAEREAEGLEALSALGKERADFGKFRRVFMYCHDARGPSRGAEPWEKAVQFAAEHDVTDLVVNFSWATTADYKSEVLTVSDGVAKKGDALEECLAACRKYGVKLHAWRCCWRLGFDMSKSVVDSLEAEGRLQRSFNGKVIRDFLCPSNPANHRMHVEAMVELAKKGVDGIHYDYIRYGNGHTTSCFCDRCRKAFEKELGHKIEQWPEDVVKDAWLLRKWGDFRCFAISCGVRDIAKRVRAECPGVEISSSAGYAWKKLDDGRMLSGDWIYGRAWAAWAKKGWVDFVITMSYNYARDSFREWMEAYKATDVGNAFVVPMIGPSCWPAEGAEADAVRILGHSAVVKSLGFADVGIYQFDTRTYGYLPTIKQGKHK